MNKQKDILSRLDSEAKQTRKELMEYTLNYLRDHHVKELEVFSNKSYVLHHGRNVFCNYDALRIEFYDDLLCSSITIQGFVGKHKEIMKICRAKEEIKGVLDTFIKQACNRTYHNCISDEELIRDDKLELDLD